MNVATQYPAVTDDNGTTWYRPAFEGASPPKMWGWTGLPEHAHPDYAVNGSSPAADNQPRKDPPMIEMKADGAPDTGRYSEWSRYPLPPELPREEAQFDGYGRYKLPSPTTGRLTSYTRATTVAGTTSDDFNLVQWKIRTKVLAALKGAEQYGVLMSPQSDSMSDTDQALAAAFVEFQKALAGGKPRAANDAIDLMDNLTGGRDSAELGGAVHDWLGALDLGQVLLHQIPEQFQPYAISYQNALARAGLVAVPEYVERLVLNERGEETVVGRIDRIYRCIETGELYLGDLKTSKTLDFSLLEYGIQFAVYGYATLMMELDGVTWVPMPEINQDICVCVHVPSDQPERSQVVPFDLYAGGEGMITALEVRRQRKDIPKRVLGGTTPIPSKSALRYVEARQALQSMRTVDDAVDIQQTYQDVWTDDLQEFGATCFELTTATDTEE